MAFENLDTDDDAGFDESPPPEESGNRTFLIFAGILGAIAVLALICIAAYALFLLPQRRQAAAVQVATVNAQNTQVAMQVAGTSTAVAFAAAITPTPTNTPVPPTNTPAPTNTPVVVVATTAAATDDPRTATVAALLTQAAVATQTVVPTSTALPNTGFAEDVGLPTMLGLAALLVVVAFVARRLRTA